MTEAELWQMMLLSIEDLSVNLETVLTTVFAYLAAAYFVGKKLTRFQAALISFFFMVAAGVAGFMALVMWRRATYFLDQLVNRFGVETFAPNQPRNRAFRNLPGAIHSGLRLLHVTDSQTPETRS